MTLLKCAHCGCGNTRHYGVTIYDREDDARSGDVLCVATFGDGTFDFLHKKQSPAASRQNPSPRNHAVEIEILCDECKGVSSVEVFHDDAGTHIGCRKVVRDDVQIPMVN